MQISRRPLGSDSIPGIVLQHFRFFGMSICAVDSGVNTPSIKLKASPYSKHPQQDFFFFNFISRSRCELHALSDNYLKYPLPSKLITRRQNEGTTFNCKRSNCQCMREKKKTAFCVWLVIYPKLQCAELRQFFFCMLLLLHKSSLRQDTP